MFEASQQVAIFYNSLLIINLLTFIDLYSHPRKFMNKIPYNHWLEVGLFIFCLLMIGFREWRVEDVFVDSIRYGEAYEILKFENVLDGKDTGFLLFSYICKLLGCSVNVYFIICAFFYLFPLYKVSKIVCGKYSFFLFLICVSSFSFYNYGVNVIRSGIATSVLLLAIINYKDKSLLFTYAFIGMSIHISVLLPFVITLIVLYSKIKEKYCLLIWGISIVLSPYVTDILKTFFLDIGFMEERASMYLTEEADSDVFSKVGFRWDFVIYSALPIVIGIYCIFRKNIKNVFYLFLFKIYLLTNAIWILVCSVPYSDRFAYLSWFMMPVLVFYPFYVTSQLNGKKRNMSFCVLFYYLGTYILVCK